MPSAQVPIRVTLVSATPAILLIFTGLLLKHNIITKDPGHCLHEAIGTHIHTSVYIVYVSVLLSSCCVSVGKQTFSYKVIFVFNLSYTVWPWGNITVLRVVENLFQQIQSDTYKHGQLDIKTKTMIFLLF